MVKEIKSIFECKKDSLVVVWSSGDRDLVKKMVSMYTLNSKLENWWKDVTLIIWGPACMFFTNEKYPTFQKKN